MDIIFLEAINKNSKNKTLKHFVVEKVEKNNLNQKVRQR